MNTPITAKQARELTKTSTAKNEILSRTLDSIYGRIASRAAKGFSDVSIFNVRKEFKDAIIKELISKAYEVCTVTIKYSNELWMEIGWR